MTDAPSAPLEEHDPGRARELKAKIRDRVADVRRHLVALRTAMAEFGEDFDLEAFRTAYASEDPVVLNRVKAVERGADQLYNYVVELTAFGLELAEVRARDADLKRPPGPSVPPPHRSHRSQARAALGASARAAAPARP